LNPPWADEFHDQHTTVMPLSWWRKPIAAT
jgi:hypothetical protein